MASESDPSIKVQNELKVNESVDKSDDETEVTEAAFDKLQMLANESLEHLQEKREPQSSSSNAENCVPGPLAKSGLFVEEVRSRLLSLIARAEDEEEEETAISYVRPRGVLLDEIQRVALLSHMMAAYVGIIDEHVLYRVSMQLVSETTLWISRIFRFFDSSAYFHSDGNEGLVRMIRLVLHIRYPKYSSEGYEALYTRPPIIYYSESTKPGLGQYLCSELGLPASCIKSVPTNTIIGSQCKMDTSALEKMILEDISAAKIPLLIAASAGSALLGHVDNLQRVKELGQSHNIWLHVDGHNLAALSLVSASNLPSYVGDSVTLSFGKWIGVSSLPFITLYRSQDAVTCHTAGLNHISKGKLDFLPLWVCLQVLGCEVITERIQHCFELTDYLMQKIEEFPEFRIIGKERPKSKDGSTYDITTVGKKSIGTNMLLDVMSSVVVFQYIPAVSGSGDEKSTHHQRNPSYYDNLNSWLVQLLTRSVPSVKTDILDLEEYGICLRICLLETAHLSDTKLSDIDEYYVCLQQQLTILNSTVHQRDLLYKNHSNHRKLKLVQISEWAGMGGARYIPEFWADRLNELTDTGKEDINNLNADLVAKLRASDSAFSVGEADDGMLCVRFGMVDDQLNMDELISLVISLGQEIEDSSKFLETMAEMVKHGIEEANKELSQENEEKLLQEGVLRQVPVLGSLVSWWFPSQAETGIKGRSFNLSSGAVESTENIYKYHMQIKEGLPQTPPPASKVLINPSSSQVLPGVQLQVSNGSHSKQ